MGKRSNHFAKILNPRKLAQLITAIHNNPELLPGILSGDDIPSKDAHIVGITGSTATGKSTLIDKIIYVLRKDGFTVIVLAIDPTEEESGGALLGDTIRMRDHYLDPGVFLRSFGSRGASSAVTQYLPQVVELVSRFADVVVIESAGAGQSDMALEQCVHTLVTLLDTRADAINLLKAGHHNRAHILAVNVRTGSQEDEMFFSFAKSFVRTFLSRNKWTALISRVNAKTGEGVAGLVSQLYVHRKFLSEGGVKDELA